MQLVAQNEPFPPPSGENYKYEASFVRQRTPTERVIMKSSVAKHHGCKHATHCGLIANGRSHVLHTVWCYIFGEAAGEILNWSLLGAKCQTDGIERIEIFPRKKYETASSLTAPAIISSD